MTNLSSIISGGGGDVPTWVSGGAYVVDDDVWSPASGHCYRCIVDVTGTTDPSADGTNWKLIGPGGIKFVQRGTITVADTSATATLSQAVILANTELRFLGARCDTPDADVAANTLTLTNTTTVTASKGTITGTSYVSWEVTERWA